MPDYHSVFDSVFSTFRLPPEPLSLREDVRKPEYACPNCNHQISNQGCTLPESLTRSFPLYHRDLWCDYDCLTEWIQDNASRIARDGMIREVEG